jgi:hypothetical protein
MSPELRQLLTAAYLQVWQDMAGSLILCEVEGETRAELPPPRNLNGRRAPSVQPDDDDTWSQISLTTAKRPELIELLMAARFCV